MIPEAMDNSRNWLIRILAWRAKQPAEVSWFAASGLFLAALVARILAGRMYGANPAMVFYPAILIAAAVLGWKEATAVLVLSVAVGAYLFVPPDMYLMPAVWLFIGGLNIALLAGLQHIARELIAADEHRRALASETNAGGTARAALLSNNPAERRGRAEQAGPPDDTSEPAFATVVDLRTADLTISVEPSDVAFDRMQAITTLALTSGGRVHQERVFRNAEGAKLTISLRAIDSGRPVLTVVNYGPELPPLAAAPDGTSVMADAKA